MGSCGAFRRIGQKAVIRIIATSSPQAKGRVEQNHRVHQDRLIKRPAAEGIDSYATENQHLEQKYLPGHNRRFARAAAKPEDYQGRKATVCELRQIFHLETKRTISKEWVIRYNGCYLLLQPGNVATGPRKVWRYANGRTETGRCTTAGSEWLSPNCHRPAQGDRWAGRWNTHASP
ncbi:MAG TPA: hypothetical protein VEI52_01155 [Terriglobales bacterium]|nr:hypothetical protein [Terriglobales bacterium]